MIDFDQNQEDVAWGHWLIQFEGKETAHSIVTAIHKPMTTLWAACGDVLNKRGVDTAEGKQLDGVGEIVGVTREIPNSIFLSFFGFKSQPAGKGFGKARMRHKDDPYAGSTLAPDLEYRDMIRAKIRLNNSFGSAEDITEAAKQIFKAPAAYVSDSGNAVAKLWIGRVPNDQETPYAFYEKLIPRLGGVRLVPVFYSANTTFGFSNQGFKGFGVGVLSRLAA